MLRKVLVYPSHHNIDDFSEFVELLPIQFEHFTILKNQALKNIVRWKRTRKKEKIINLFNEGKKKYNKVKEVEKKNSSTFYIYIYIYSLLEAINIGFCM